MPTTKTGIGPTLDRNSTPLTSIESLSSLDPVSSSTQPVLQNSSTLQVPANIRNLQVSPKSSTLPVPPKNSKLIVPLSNHVLERNTIGGSKKINVRSESIPELETSISGAETPQLSESRLDMDSCNLLQERKKKMGYKFVLLWKILGLCALFLNLLSLILLVLAYSTEQWEVIHYSEDTEANLTKAMGVATAMESHSNYYIIRFNESSHNVNGTVSQVNLAVSKKIIDGIFQQCDTVEKESRLSLERQGVIWLTEQCIDHSSTGPSGYSRGSPEYFRLSMTRISQACMLISTICLVSTLIMGIITFLYGQILLCISTSTLCFAAALYLMFTGITSVRRKSKALSPLLYKSMSVPIVTSESKAGASLSYIWSAMVLTIFSASLWLAVHRLITRYMKGRESEASGSQDHGFCCRS